MKLHTNEPLFLGAVKEAADNLGIKEYFIEKDYWITLTKYYRMTSYNLMILQIGKRRKLRSLH